jgi:Reverse transcriptase (RNA-dependent DNA polymerase)
MLNFGIAFEVLPEGKDVPPGWTKVTGHLVWDLKMDFTRKARWVFDGHKTPSPIGSTYARVVSLESVRIAFTYAALNGLNVCSADKRNAYLQAPSSQKDYIICGAEFGLENVGRIALIHRALYGGKAAGRDFRNHLRSCMRHLDFFPCLADPDIWMRPAKHSNGQDYYEYVLLYTDDELVIAKNANVYCEMKLESILN